MIRAMSAADAPDMAALHAACFERAWPAPDFIRYANDPAVLALVAEDGAGAVMAQQAGDDWDVLTLMVDPRHRRAGVGAALMAALIARAAPSRIVLEVASDNVAAMALYRHCGFEQIGRRKGYYPSGADALVLALANGQVSTKPGMK